MTDTLLELLPFLLFLAILLTMDLGCRYRLALQGRAPQGGVAVGAVSAAVLPLMGLVLAFSFSNAAGRLDASRITILNEVNAIETMWMRVDLAEPEAQPRLQELVRNYLDTRIRAYEIYPERIEYARQVEDGARLRREIWDLAIKSTTVTVNRTLLLTSINVVSDTAAVRTLSLGTHLPGAVLAFLTVIILTGALLIGVMFGETGSRQWLGRIVVATVLSLTVFAIMDMEYPRLGIRLLDRADAMLVDLRRTMN